MAPYIIESISFRKAYRENIWENNVKSFNYI